MNNASCITHVIFSGGGIKGLCYMGVLRYLYIEKLIDKIKHVAGTSIGAYFALLLALKIPIDYLEEEISKSIKQFSENEMAVNKNNIGKLFCSNGLYNTDFLSKPIRDFLQNKYGVDDLNYIEFVKKTGVNIYISCTNLNTVSNKVFSVESTPNISVIDTVMASLSIPFVFEPIYIDGEYYVDGVISGSLHVDNIFQDINNNNKIGFLLSTSYKDEVEKCDIDTEFNFLTYTGRILQVILSKSLENPVEFNDVEKYFHIMKLGKLPYEKIVKFKIQDNEIYVDITVEDFDNLILKGFIEITNYMNNRYKDKCIDNM